ncbi:MAG TPA: hypothetical protein VLU41_17910 [Ideonella sp.]|nr:hypothetical protein [Ideonella sp.]
MKLSALAAAAALGLAGLSSAAFAQNSTDTSREQLTSEPSAEAPAAARKEAAAAWAQAQKDCRKEQGRDAQRECLRVAKQDRDRLLKEAREGAKSR